MNDSFSSRPKLTLRVPVQHSYASRPTQTVVITGGNHGLGFACAETLAYADKNWCVIIAGHDREKIVAATDKLRKKCNAKVEPMLLNLGSLRSIRYFAENLSDGLRDGCFPPLRALICNAGVHPATGLAYTADGYEQTFGVNHLGHFLLVNLLLRQFSPPGRIIIVSGSPVNPLNLDWLRNRFSPLEAAGLAWPESPGGLHMNGFRRYRASKHCNLLFAAELDRRLANASPETRLADITVNVFDPSVTPGTRLVRAWPRLLQRVWQSPTLHALARCLGANLATVERAGRSLAGLVLNPELEGVSGKYFRVLKERHVRDIVCNQALAKKLWLDSAEIVSWRRQADEYVHSPVFVSLEQRAFVLS